ncbi:hypothetical protein ACLB6G_16980 [Zhengella sp. ZM62]
MTIRNAFARTVSNIARQYRRHRTHRILESLPAEIRKDIGYLGGSRDH